jgi:uncharacterized membrane protein
MTNSSRILLAATLAGALAVPMTAAPSGTAAPKDDQKPVHCYGVNKCKGVGDCGGPGHSCKGMNSCKGQGYLDLQKDACLKINGGRLTPAAQK